MAARVDASLPNIHKERIQKAYVKVKKAAVFCMNQTGDGGTVNSVAKFAKGVFEFLAAFEPIADIFGPAGAFLKSFSEVYKIVGVFKGGHDFVTAQKVRKAVSSLLGISTAGLAMVKLINSFGWINLANISAAFGKVAVIGSLAVVPVGIFASWLEGIKAVIDISIAISDLIETAKKITHLNKKLGFWKHEFKQDQATRDHCDIKIHKYRKIEKEYASDIALLEEKLEDIEEKITLYKDEQASLNKSNAWAVKLFRRMRPPKATRKLRKYEKLNDKVKKSIKETEKTQSTLHDKRISWQRIQKRYEDDDTIGNVNDVARYEIDRREIDGYIQAKVARTKLKKRNVRLEQFRTVSGILINGAVIVLIGGSTALFIAGLFASPVGTAGVIPFILPAIGLVVGTVGLGLSIFKMYKPKKKEKLKLPEFDPGTFDETMKKKRNYYNPEASKEPDEDARIDDSKSDDEIDEEASDSDTVDIEEAVDGAVAVVSDLEEAV